MIVKMTIVRLLGSSDDKEKIGAARPKGPPLRGFRYPVSGRESRGSRLSRVSGQRPESSSVGSTDGSKRGIGALDVLCSRDDASRARVKSSAPVESMKNLCIPSV